MLVTTDVVLEVREFHVAMHVAEMTRTHYQRLLRAGYGEGDISALFREQRGTFLRGKDRPKSI